MIQQSGLLVEACFGLLALGDVPSDNQHVVDATGGIADHAVPRLDMMHRSVTADEAILHALADPGSNGFGENRVDALPVIRENFVK